MTTNKPPMDIPSLRETITELWKRARINAFAHKFTSENFARKNRVAFILGLVSAVLSIFFVILVYLMNNPTDGGGAKKLIELLGFNQEITPLVCTLSSIVMSLISIVITVIASTEKFDSYCAEHRFFCNSYQYIAQRAREVNWPDKPVSEVIELLKDLERDFQLLKARGPEPNNSNFEKANALFKKIREDKSFNAPQSFRPSKDDSQVVPMTPPPNKVMSLLRKIGLRG